MTQTINYNCDECHQMKVLGAREVFPGKKKMTLTITAEGLLGGSQERDG